MSNLLEQPTMTATDISAIVADFDRQNARKAEARKRSA